jgi:hypothetical protein
MTDEHDLFGNKIPPEPRYDIGDGKTIGRNSLREANHETQIAAPKNWFFANYEDPVENTPYIGSEGGYQFIHGGPFEARAELENEFSTVIPDGVIDEVVESVERYSDEWAPRVLEYDPDLFESITSSTEQYMEFTETLENTRMLAAEDIPQPRQQHLYRLLYVNAVIAFETYLCDTFIANVCSNRERIRKFVETDRRFSKQTMLVGDLFNRSEAIEEEVRDYLFDLLWHRISDASRMFLEVLNVRVPSDLKALEEAVRVRHSIVHHGGKKDGKVRQVTKEDIAAVIQAVHDVVWSLESQIHPEGFNRRKVLIEMFLFENLLLHRRIVGTGRGQDAFQQEGRSGYAAQRSKDLP